MPFKVWTDTHTEVAEYLIVRGVTVKAVAAILGTTSTTVYRYLGHVQAVRTDYRTRLVTNCAKDFEAIGVDLDEALRVIIEGEEERE